jgi:mannose-6-phosphate isomerase-like protein (cupin superfamily)
MSVWTPLTGGDGAGAVSYTEFLRSDALSAGFYRLQAGSPDPQQPHNEDEVYCVVSGRGKMRLEEDLFDIGPGSVAFVPAHAAHRFESIVDDLVMLVVFAPPETDAD